MTDASASSSLTSSCTTPRTSVTGLGAVSSLSFTCVHTHTHTHRMSSPSHESHSPCPGPLSTPNTYFLLGLSQGLLPSNTWSSFLLELSPSFWGWGCTNSEKAPGRECGARKSRRGPSTTCTPPIPPPSHPWAHLRGESHALIESWWPGARERGSLVLPLQTCGLPRSPRRPGAHPHSPTELGEKRGKGIRTRPGRFQ